MVKFSFVIPAFNRKNHIINALEALNYQDGYDKSAYEVILVDDGSEDDFYGSAKEIAKNYRLKYVYLERCKDSCLSRARNYGWRNSEGELVVFIDSDIIVGRNYLHELERYYAKEKNLMLIGTRLMLQREVASEIIRSGEVFSKHSFNGSNFEVFENRHYFFNQYSYNASAIRDFWLKVYGCNFVLPKVWLEKTGGFDETFKGWGVEDIEFAYNLHNMGIKIFVNSKLEVLHQFHGGSDLIGEDKYEAYERNINYLYKKHLYTLELYGCLIIEYLKGKEHIIDLSANTEKPLSKMVLDFKDKSRLEEIKELILKFSAQSHTEVVVNDYIEDTDLDIWIQLLGKRESTPKYYPVSKLFKRKAIYDLL